MDRDTAELLLPGAAFLFGAAIGSFLNVVIYRLPLAKLSDEELAEAGVTRPMEGISISFPRRSFCPHCKEQIAATDNLPIASYVLLGGKCRKCRAPIPFRYFFVELFTAVLFAFTAARFQPDVALVAVHCALAAALVAVTFIDIDWQIIPDEISWPGIFAGPILSLALPQIHAHAFRGKPFDDLTTLGISVPSSELLASVMSSGIGVAVGAGSLLAVAWGFDLVLWILRKMKLTELEESMGYGDVKLLAMLGGFIGWKGVILTFLIACIVGSFVGVPLRRITGDRYIPFGPFLALGGFAVVLYRPEMYDGIDRYLRLLGV